MKKVLSIVLSIVMVLCMMPAMAFADTATYSDIAGAKCEAAVEELAELGVVTGYPDGTYKPEGVVTRAEMASLIVKALGLNPTAGTTAFTDMDAAKWAIPYVGYAESLGIIEGYGNGLFGPNDTVTYDQAITMVVRALGYTEDCNEMQGQWPAVFVQKANELALLKDVATTGSAGAPRGEVAILLANALEVQMVYADKDGQTIGKTDADGTTAVTMLSTLIGEVGTTYGVVTQVEAAAANKNIRPLIGAAGTILANEDGDVISVSDVKTTFLTGTYTSTGTKFKTDDATYTVKGYRALNATTGAVETADAIPVFVNGAKTSTAAALTNGVESTVAATISGKNIYVYSTHTWDVKASDVIEQIDLDTLAKKDTLLTKSFVMTEDGEIDTNSFILEGVDSLADIALDDVVYVYTTGTGANEVITKVSVGTEIVTGVFEEYNAAKDEYTIGTATYTTTAAVDSSAKIEGSVGDTVDAYLDFAGDIYQMKIVDEAKTVVAVLRVEKGDSSASLSNEADKALVRVLTEAGEYITYKVDEEELGYGTVDAGTGALNVTGAAITPGVILKITLNADGEIKAVTDAALSTTTNGKVTDAGYVAGIKIDDSAVIFKVGSATVDGGKGYEDKNVTLVSKADVLGATDIAATSNVDKGLIKVMKITSGLEKSNTVFGVVIGQTDVNNDKTPYKISVLVDGKTETYLTATDFTSRVNKATEITLDGTKAVTGKAISSKIGATITISEEQEISGVVVNGTISDTAFNADAPVYVQAEDGTWAVGSVSDLDKNDDVWFFDLEEKLADRDKVADMIVVFKHA